MRTITSARLVDGNIVDLLVDDRGRVAEVRPSGVSSLGVSSLGGSSAGGSSSDVADLDASTNFDAGGWLLLPAPGEPHAHLDKALTADKVPNPKGDLMGAIEAWIDAAERGVFGLEEMTERAVEAIAKLMVNGVGFVRTHVNVGDSDPDLVHLRAVNAATARFAGRVDIQTVALMHSPLAGTDGAGNRAALRAALEAGAGLVGGCPHLETDGAGMIDVALAAAREFDVAVDLHVDETLDSGMLTLETLARKVIDTGFPNRVTASHCVSLSMQSVEVQRRVARVVAEAGISIVPLPQTNLFLQGWDHPTATPRGITPIPLLLDHGVTVAAGADNVQDPFNPMGRSDPLETAALLVMAAHVSADVAYDLVSNAVRRVAGRPEVDFSVGSPADFLAIDAPSLRAAVADAPPARASLVGGRPVCVTRTTRWVDEGP